MNIDPSAEYFIPDSCFADNELLSNFIFGESIDIDDFSENALSGSFLTSIILKGIKNSELTSGQRIDFDVSENMISDYSTEHRLPYELYEYYYPGDMTGKQLYYGCIYDDLCACIDFCDKNQIPLVILYSSDLSTSVIKNNYNLFGNNYVYQYNKYFLNNHYYKLNVFKEESTFTKKLTYNWIQNQPYIFCFTYNHYDFNKKEFIKTIAALKNIYYWYKTD